MKKIVSAVALAAVAASLATAEVAVSSNIRVRPELYKVAVPKDGDNVTTFADLDGYGKASDTLSVKGSTDYAGVQIDLTVTSGVTKNGDGSNDGDTAVVVDNYKGWLKFGDLQFSAGVFDTRFTNRGNYTATEEGILDKEFSKAYGPAKTDGSSYFSNFENVSQTNGGNYLSFLADYTLADVGGGKLLLRGGLVENTADASVKNTNISSAPYDDTAEFDQSAGWMAEAAWSKKDLMNVDVIFKNPANKYYGFGLYVTPLMVPNSKNFVVGLTYGLNAGADDGDFQNTLAADLRFQYNINSAATVALGAKYEQSKVKGADTESAMQAAAEFSYKINDTVTVALDAGYFNTDLDDNDEKDQGEQTFVTSLRGKFTAGKNAAITTALRLNKVLNDGDLADSKTVTTFDIPVVFRVKL